MEGSEQRSHKEKKLPYNWEIELPVREENRFQDIKGQQPGILLISWLPNERLIAEVKDSHNLF